MEKKYLSVKEVREIYGINKDKLYELINEGTLFKYKSSGTKLSVEELDAYMEGQKGGE